jgi:selenocysteine lyase/cysteine desulfurase
MVLPNQKLLFDIPADVTFLNCSYMSPLLSAVRKSGIEGMTKRGCPWTIKIDDWFLPAEELRTLFASLIHSNKENIALIPSVSYGMAVAAKNILLGPNQKIILLDQQYPSNVYPWRELSTESGAEIITVKRPSGLSWTDAILEKIDEHTGLVAIPNCHWTDGSLIDLEAISKRTKKVKAKLVIDASQSLGAYPLDVERIKPDFLVTVGYKWLLGPYGLGYFYCDQKYCEPGKPIENPWLNRKGSEDFTRLADYTDEFKSGARRFDGGEFPDFIRIPMAITALTQILDWGVVNIHETLLGITNEIERLARQSGYETPEIKDCAGHVIGIKIPDHQAREMNKKLSDHNIYVSFRGTNMRVAPYLYNTLDDVKRLFEFF